MPTPFVHLKYAMELMSHRNFVESLNELLFPVTGAFLLGNTAADIQTLTSASRSSTHFYRIRGVQPCWGWEMMLSEYPKLANPYQLDFNQAAFISGYLVHLLWDEMWTRNIFVPYYMNATWWSDRMAYALHHNALRVILDRKAHTELRKHRYTINQVAAAHPDNWLPFSGDHILVQWRDWLVEQLQDDVESHTVQVFASRMGVPKSQFNEVIHKLEVEGVEDIPGLASAMASTHKQASTASLSLLMRYWQMDNERQGIHIGTVNRDDSYSGTV